MSKEIDLCCGLRLNVHLIMCHFQHPKVQMSKNWTIDEVYKKNNLICTFRGTLLWTIVDKFISGVFRMGYIMLFSFNKTTNWMLDCITSRLMAYLDVLLNHLILVTGILLQHFPALLYVFSYKFLYDFKDSTYL